MRRGRLWQTRNKTTGLRMESRRMRAHCGRRGQERRFCCRNRCDVLTREMCSSGRQSSGHEVGEAWLLMTGPTTGFAPNPRPPILLALDFAAHLSFSAPFHPSHSAGSQTSLSPRGATPCFLGNARHRGANVGRKPPSCFVALTSQNMSWPHVVLLIRGKQNFLPGTSWSLPHC